jgi:hypothetical protein
MHKDQITLDQVAQRRCNLSVEFAPRELDHDPVDRPSSSTSSTSSMDTLLFESEADGQDHVLPPTSYRHLGGIVHPVFTHRITRSG